MFKGQQGGLALLQKVTHKPSMNYTLTDYSLCQIKGLLLNSYELEDLQSIFTKLYFKSTGT